MSDILYHVPFTPYGPRCSRIQTVTTILNHHPFSPIIDSMSEEKSVVTMYTMKTCKYCALAKQIFSEYGVTPNEIVVDADPAKMPELVSEMVERTGKRSVPQIFIEERYVGGYEDLQALYRSRELTVLLGATN